MIFENRAELFGRLNVWFAPNGPGDLPTTGGGFGIGDIVVNGSVTNGPAFWQVLTASPSPTFKSSGGGATLRSTGTTGAITVSDGIVLLTTGGLTMTMPAATGWPIGKTVIIKNTAGTSSTIATVSGNIDGASTYTLTTTSEIELTSDGTNYFIIGK